MRQSVTAEFSRHEHTRFYSDQNESHEENQEKVKLLSAWQHKTPISERSGLRANAAGSLLTAWLSVQFCMPGRHHEVAGRWRDTWQRCAWGHFPCTEAPPDHCMDQLKDTQEAQGCQRTAGATATATSPHCVSDWFSELSFSALFFYLYSRVVLTLQQDASLFLKDLHQRLV